MATASTHASPATRPATPKLDPGLAATWKAFGAAFNRQDPKEVASFWEQDGTLIGPTGTWGVGRSGVEKVYASDVEKFLRGTRSTFEVEAVRAIGRDLACIDLEHAIENAYLPDGSKGTLRLHLMVVARRSGDEWRWLDARPYAFLPEPPPASVH
jgi:uncharacterized protein (TIGR02246 family)